MSWIRTRYPGRLYQLGEEPDARFTLANERTYLAWIRTSLAMTAGGVALESLVLNVNPGFRTAAALVLTGCGVILPTLAWLGWHRTESALRSKRRLPAAVAPLLLGIAVTVAAIFLAIGTELA